MSTIVMRIERHLFMPLYPVRAGCFLIFYDYSKDKGGDIMSENIGGYSPFTSTGAILVLFILLVIISKSLWV